MKTPFMYKELLLYNNKRNILESICFFLYYNSVMRLFSLENLTGGQLSFGVTAGVEIIVRSLFDCESKGEDIRRSLVVL
ncbi:hypothetical protein MDV063.5 [Gallid alphaherpesvirus 2]|nr:hypothetical protein MDV063.5 [Gallid alphaherpesvirus 2]